MWIDFYFSFFICRFAASTRIHACTRMHEGSLPCRVVLKQPWLSSVPLPGGPCTSGIWWHAVRSVEYMRVRDAKETARQPPDRCGLTGIRGVLFTHDFTCRESAPEMGNRSYSTPLLAMSMGGPDHAPAAVQKSFAPALGRGGDLYYIGKCITAVVYSITGRGGVVERRSV